MVESFFQTPLQIMRAIEDVALCVYLLSPTGGVVQGDVYEMTVDAGENTHVLLTTQAATKVYRMPLCDAVQTLKIEVRADAVFEYLPDALILFRDADLKQDIQIMLHPGAMLMMQEIVMPGRIARNEILDFKRYRSRIIVRDTDGLLLYDSINIQPKSGDVDRIGLFDGYPCWGTWYLLGDRINATEFCAAHHTIFDEESPGSLSPLHRNGVCARMVSRRLEPIYKSFQTLWQSARAEYLGLSATILRK